MRLNTDQFLALRSIAKEPWDMQWGRIQWRFNGKWCHLFRRHGVRAPLGSVDGIGGHCGYDDVFDRAWDAAWALVAYGLVEEFTVRCCPGTSCHANDREEFRLTPRGVALLEKANATSQRRKSVEPTAPDVPSVPVESMNRGPWWRKAASLLPWRRASERVVI